MIENKEDPADGRGETPDAISEQITNLVEKTDGSNGPSMKPKSRAHIERLIARVNGIPYAPPVRR